MIDLFFVIFVFSQVFEINLNFANGYPDGYSVRTSLKILQADGLHVAIL